MKRLDTRVVAWLSWPGMTVWVDEAHKPSKLTVGKFSTPFYKRTPPHAFRAISPPSTGMIAPVRNEAAGKHRLSVMCATSSGSP